MQHSSTVTDTEPVTPRETITMEGKSEQQSPPADTGPAFNNTQFVQYAHVPWNDSKHHPVWDNDVTDEMRQMLRTHPPVIQMLRARFALEKLAARISEQETTRPQPEEANDNCNSTEDGWRCQDPPPR
jgi:hypothetical protein